MTKAIQTRYGGCYFRSRIEARWARFFDCMGIIWEYEPQGFELKSGPYLPDFQLLLGGKRVWWEVKGEKPTEQEMQALFDLSLETRQLAYIAWGAIPRDYLDDPRISDPSGNLVRWFATPKAVGWAPAGLDVPGIDNPRLFNAYSTARSARFEHGEVGRSA